MSISYSINVFFFFFNDTATTEIYTLSLHDALPIFELAAVRLGENAKFNVGAAALVGQRAQKGLGRRAVVDDDDLESRVDRKSTRLNSSHLVMSYAVFCFNKKIISAILNQCCFCDDY